MSWGLNPWANSEGFNHTTNCSISYCFSDYEWRITPLFGFCSTTWLEVFLLPLDGLLINRGLLPSIFKSICWYSFLHLGGERRCENKHDVMTPSWTPTRSAWPDLRLSDNKPTTIINSLWRQAPPARFLKRPLIILNLHIFAVTRTISL